MGPNPMVRALSACMLASSALLSACGGGGSGSSTSNRFSIRRRHPEPSLELSKLLFRVPIEGADHS